MCLCVEMELGSERAELEVGLGIWLVRSEDKSFLPRAVLCFFEIVFMVF